MKKFLKGISLYILIFIIIIFFAQVFNNTNDNKTKLTYTQFIAEVENKRIKEVHISDFGGTSVISGKLGDDRKFEVTVPSSQFNTLAQDYAERGIINIIYDKPQQTSVWLSILPSAALIVLVIV
ncbi:MAG: hypothetical protein GX154_02150, partial [Clostridiales bacterium]|nr:hypothetical protein [Clostridiales bacterium]